MSTTSVVERFDALLGRIQPNTERLKLAEQLPRLIRQELAQSPILRTTEPHTLLVGSYRRHTAVGGIKDVDVAVIVASDYANAPPTVVLDDLSRALQDARKRKRLRSVERRDQRRSIRCQLPDDDFLIDLVPVVTASGDPYGELYIPDRDLGRWVPTRSIGYLRAFSELNATYDGKLVPLLKLLKHWKEQQRIDRFQAKSFWLEALTVDLARRGRIFFDGSWSHVMQSALRALYERCLPVYNAGRATPVVPDPMIPGANVAHNWTREGFTSFFGRLEASNKAAAAAVSSDDGAVAAWRRVFGQEFAPAWSDDLPTAAAWMAVGAAGIWAFRELLKRA